MYERMKVGNLIEGGYEYLAVLRKIHDLFLDEGESRRDSVTLCHGGIPVCS